ncbi:MAG: hypothetical protein M1819_004000 [Sarea resinae]|nr:MAG: hypothetical protein M1819_004000 [Sarea resinae]
MSTTTFDLPHSSPPIPITLPPSTLSQSQLLSFPAFKNWIATLQHSLSLQHTNTSHPFHTTPYKLKSIEVQAVDFFGGGERVGFVKLRCEVKNDKGEGLPGSVFLRGGSVGLMIILQPDDVALRCEDDKHVLLTLQPRIPAGSLSFPELPAGMIDDSGTFAGAAAREIQEETGLEIPSSDLINLTELALSPLVDPVPNSNSGRGPGSHDGPSDSVGSEDAATEAQEKLQQAIYPSPGGSDEFIPVFLHQKRIPRRQLAEWGGKLTGLRDEGEKITLRLCRLEELWRVGGRDGKALGAWALYEGLRRAGKL